MRRKDKEITNIGEIQSIIKESLICRIGMSDGNIPYVVPMCFGYKNGMLYLHSANQGMKIDIIRRNPNVCVEFDVGVEVVQNDDNCRTGMRYRSVFGFGTASIVTDRDEIRFGLDAIVEQYGGEPKTYPDNMLDKLVVIRINFNQLTGKKSGY